MTFKLPVIIPSAIDRSGFTKDYFTEGHINQLPLVHKTLIRYLIDDLLKKNVKEKIDSIFLVIDTDQEENYKKILPEIDEGRISCQYQFADEEKGIISVVEKVIKEKKKEIGKGPFLVFLGDTLLEDKFLKKIVDKAEDLWKTKRNEPWLVVGLVKDTKRIIEKKESYNNPENDFTRNVEGYLIVNEESLKKSSDITQNDILDAINSPSYPELYLEKGTIPLIETGVLIFSQEAWQKLKVLKHRDPHGFYSTINIIRRGLIENENIEMHGIVAESEEMWLDINYPWDYLKANNYMANCLAGCERFPNPNLHGTVYKVFKPEELRNKFKYKPIFEDGCLSKPILFKYTNKDDDIGAWGVHENAIIEDPVIVPDPEKYKIFIGEGAHIKGCCVLKKNCRIRDYAQVVSSVIGENVFIDSFSIVDHSIIMKDTNIFCHSMIAYSIIGKKVTIGGNTFTACQRLSINSKSSEKQKIVGVYYTDNHRIRYTDRFSAIIGDNTQIGMNVSIQPGKKIGKKCIIYPGSEIRKNYSSESTIRTLRETEEIEETKYV